MVVLTPNRKGYRNLLENIKKSMIPDQFVIVSAMGERVSYRCYLPVEIRIKFTNDPLFYEKVNEFLATSKPGDFIELGDDRIMFRTQQEV
jgi:hypothetical protein